MKKIGTKTDVLSALDELIAKTLEKPQQPDEFTLQQYMDKYEAAGQKLNERTARCRLRKMEQDGVITLRKINVNGYLTNIYKIAKP